jgi:hypothetical protein
MLLFHDKAPLQAEAWQKTPLSDGNTSEHRVTPNFSRRQRDGLLAQ